jgi:hypothetical protein
VFRRRGGLAVAPEDDGALVGYVQLFSSRRTQLRQAIASMSASE